MTRHERRAARHERRRTSDEQGSALVLVTVSLIILTALGVGILTAAYGARLHAIQIKTEAVAMLAAEAGYEKAIFWMGQQEDMLSTLQQGIEVTTGTIDFPTGYCDYQIDLYSFIGSRPIYRVVSNGYSGRFTRTINVFVMQAVSGWDMGMCRVATGPNSTAPVYFADGETIDMPLHINNLKDNPDERDININGSPQFLQAVGMGESRHTEHDVDKYASVMSLFDDGIYFDQPDSRVTDQASIQTKVDRFQQSTKLEFQFTPAAGASVSNPQPAVQLEFFVEGEVGKVRVTNNCTVRGFKQSSDGSTYDFRIKSGDPTKYETYHIYAYHVMPEDAQRSIYPVQQTYVTQSIGDVESEPGGQIFVNGNVIIGSGDPSLPGTQDAVKGKVTVVATGNIWIADSTILDGTHDAGGKPADDNPNILGLLAQGVIKVVDPGMSDYTYVDDTPVEPSGFKYVPIARPDNPSSVPGDADYHKRYLPDPMVVEAAMTVGGGGWGAENVSRGSYGGRKEASGPQDDLVIRGSLTEVARGVVGLTRGVVGLIGSDGFLKHYYMDARLLEGVLPGDIWLRGKYIPAPAGWHDYRAAN
ncbi:MAG: hypothetical protein MUO33_07975 [Sedimentisphaerales bacterium]|nr:hypothetical protein [Sedimentisphaerales bacterium]